MSRVEERRPRSTRDIFFLNSFAGDYSSAITTLTKREVAQNREGEPSVPSRLPFYISNGNFTVRDFDEEEGHGEGTGEKGETVGGPFELLMREELSRLLSINFSNYVAEDVPPEENRPSPSRPRASLQPFLLSSSLSLISFAR